MANIKISFLVQFSLSLNILAPQFLNSSSDWPRLTSLALNDDFVLEIWISPKDKTSNIVAVISLFPGFSAVC